MTAPMTRRGFVKLAALIPAAQVAVSADALAGSGRTPEPRPSGLTQYRGWIVSPEDKRVLQRSLR